MELNQYIRADKDPMKVSIRLLLLSAFCMGLMFSSFGKQNKIPKFFRMYRTTIIKEDGKKVYYAYKKAFKKHNIVEGYFQYLNQTYFLTKDKINEFKFKYDLLDIQGNSIIPIEATFIGTPNCALPGCVEVGNAGKVGLFHLETKSLLPPSYEFIMPDSAGNAYGYVSGTWKKLSFQNKTFTEEVVTPTLELIKSCLSHPVNVQNFAYLKSVPHYCRHPDSLTKSISLSSFHHLLYSQHFDLIRWHPYISKNVSILDFSKKKIENLPTSTNGSQLFICKFSFDLLIFGKLSEENPITIVNVTQDRKIYIKNLIHNISVQDLLSSIQLVNDTLITFKQSLYLKPFKPIQLIIDRKHCNFTSLDLETENYIVINPNDSLSDQSWGYQVPHLHTRKINETEFTRSITVNLVYQFSHNMNASLPTRFSCLPIFILNYYIADILASHGYTFPNNPELRNYVEIPKNVEKTDQIPNLSEIEAYNLRLIEERIQFLSKNEESYTRPTNDGFIINVQTQF